MQDIPESAVENEHAKEKDNADRIAIDRFCKGDPEGFHTLVLGHQDALYQLCARYMGNRQDAQDCAQEAFIKAYHALPTFRGESRFSTWLYRIAVNTCLNRKASAAQKLSSSSRNLGDEWGVDEIQISSDQPNPEHELELRQQAELVQSAIGKLREEFRIVVVLRDIQGHSYEEIQELTGLEMGTVRSRLHRARSQLALWLKGEK